MQGNLACSVLNTKESENIEKSFYSELNINQTTILNSTQALRKGSIMNVKTTPAPVPKVIEKGNRVISYVPTYFQFYTTHFYKFYIIFMDSVMAKE